MLAHDPAGAPRLHVEVHPGAPGPCIFMVHGMLSSRLQWEPNLAAVSRLGRPVVFDLWGHGRSPSPPDDAPYEVDAIVAQIDHVREALGAQRIVLCGQSFGAGLTLRYALTHPDRVIAQVFTNSLSALSPPARFALTGERLARVRLLEQGGESAMAAVRAMPIHPSKARRLDPEVKAVLVRAAESVQPPGLARLMRVTSPRLSVLDQLAQTRVPTMLVNGVWEKAFQPLRDTVASLLPACRIVDLEAGHAVNLEAADGFNAAFESFLASVRA